jgi:5-methylcytosine-specific restriction endonuclease McrA
MSSTKKLARKRFRDTVFKRDGYACKMCDLKPYPSTLVETMLDAHHITDRTLMPNGGYVESNGISLCKQCHKQAEAFHETGVVIEKFSPEELYVVIGSSFEKAVKDSERLKG